MTLPVLFYLHLFFSIVITISKDPQSNDITKSQSWEETTPFGLVWVGNSVVQGASPKCHPPKYTVELVVIKHRVQLK